MGSTGRVEIPRGAHVLEAAGKYLIPGLWDMHVHFSAPPPYEEDPAARDFALYIANGVTGVRLMGGWPAEAVSWILGLPDQIRSGARPGPRLVTAGPHLDGGKLPFPGMLIVAEPDAALPAVDSLRGLGVDFVKVYDNLDRATYLAVAEAGRQRGIPVAGHIPWVLSVSEASDAGHRSVEHQTGILVACSSEEEVLPRHAPRPSQNRISAERIFWA